MQQISGSSRRMENSQDLSLFSFVLVIGGNQVEEMSFESSRKGQDVQIVMSETAGKATRGRREDVWRLEPEGEAELLKTKVVSNGMKSIHLDPNGEGRHERRQVQNSRRQSEAPGEEGEEKKTPKRKIIRVVSEETEDYVREATDMDKEEDEEISFVPSAISVPRKPLFRSDNQCSEMTLNFWQLASVVTKEGEKPHTTNLFKKCYNESLEAKGDKPSTKLQWHEFVEKKAHRGRFWKTVGKEQYVRETWEHFCRERLRVKEFREQAENEWQAGIQYRASGSWNRQSESIWSKRNAAMTPGTRTE